MSKLLQVSKEMQEIAKKCNLTPKEIDKILKLSSKFFIEPSITVNLLTNIEFNKEFLTDRTRQYQVLKKGNIWWEKITGTTKTMEGVVGAMWAVTDITKEKLVKGILTEEGKDYRTFYSAKNEYETIINKLNKNKEWINGKLNEML